MEKEVTMTPALCEVVSKHYHLSLHPVRQLSGGEESEIWLANSDNGPVVVRISPRRRSLTRLMQTHELMLSASSPSSYSVHPLR